MKRRYIVLGVIVLIVLIFLGVLFLPRLGQFQAASTESKVRASVVEAGGQGGQTSGEGYVSPVDFEALWEQNGDIYAWLYVPGTDINEPLLQREWDDQYYVNHSSIGSMNESGALFTESKYNSKDFSDPATVVYGKNTRENRLFGNLQATFSSPSGFAEHNEIIVFLPDQEIHYTVFAAVPFRNYHILYYYNFNNSNRYQMFLKMIDSVRTVDAQRDHGEEAVPGDQLLILSTTRSGSTSTCYLVLAKRTER